MGRTVFGILLLVKFTAVTAAVTFPSEADKIAEIGKREYNSLREKTKVPSYGECWTEAIQNLHDGCQVLTENVQSDIALSFMNCFFKMSGHEGYNCHFLAGVTRRECLQDMSDRAFNVYTEFYTHTQSICFYLRSQLWHEETENTINRLTFASDRASNQLEDILDSTSNLRNALMESHVNLRTMMREFNEAAVEQKRLISHMFERLSSLQEWAVGEISWLDTVLFYLGGVVISYLLTATRRTQGARFLLFMAFSANIIVERYLCNYLVTGSLETANTLNEHVRWWVGMCRNILIGVCFLILLITAYKYRDYDLMNHALLVDIQEQNSELLGYLGKIKMLEGNMTLTPTKLDSDLEYEEIPKKPKISDESQDKVFTPNKLFPESPRSTAAVLKKTEQVITSALKSNYALPDVVRRSTSRSRLRESSSSHSSLSISSVRRKLHVEETSGRYNLRSPKHEKK